MPAVEMSSVHQYAEDLHICGYWVDVEKITLACQRAQEERAEQGEGDRPEPARPRLRPDLRRMRVREAGAADAIGRPHIAKAAGATGNLGPFFEEWLVPGAKAFVSPQVAGRERGLRPDPRGWRRAGDRPPLLGHQGSRAGRGTDPRPRHRGHREVFYPSHTRPRPSTSGPRNELGVTATALIRLPRPHPQDLQPLRRLPDLRPGQPEVPPRPAP